MPPVTRVGKSKLATNISLSSFSAFKSAKEKERSSFFVRKNGPKRTKPNDNEVKITIAVMADAMKMKIKRGESLPLKVPGSSSAKEILDAAVEKHATFNKRFNTKLKYALVFKDGTEVTTIPGNHPPEPFTLRRYLSYLICHIKSWTSCLQFSPQGWGVTINIVPSLRYCK